MIIDAHAHTNGGNLGNFKAGLLASRAFTAGHFTQDEEALRRAVNNHAENTLKKVGTDVQFISPRPFQLMHSEKPVKLVHYYAEASNEVNKMSVAIDPVHYRAVACMPQSPYEPVSAWLPELERRVVEDGFIGCLINPDPLEGEGHYPGMGDESWFPLYEKMVELDIPGLIHSGTTKNPWDYYQNYFITTETSCILQMSEHKVFDTFPNLKIIVSHGGGSIPYQIGRWRSLFDRTFHLDFDECLSKFYFDTVLYNPESIEFLVKMVGSERCLFGTENPGTGSTFNKKTNRTYDDTKPWIDGLTGITDADRANIYENTARKIFTRFKG